MKLVGIASLFAFGNAQAPFNFPASVESNLGAFFENAMSTGVFGDLDFHGIRGHGCHCYRLTDFNHRGGKPVDALDQACKVFFDKRACLRAASGPGAACANFDYQGKDYLAQLVMNDVSNPDAGVSMSPDVDFHCALETNECLKAICKVDHQAIRSLMAEAQGTQGHDFQNQASCTHTPGNGDGSDDMKICWGQSPDVHFRRIPAKPRLTATIKMNAWGDENASGCTGTIWMSQFDNPPRNRICYNLKNCGGAGAHGFHVHQKADFSNKCVSTGGHYNPTNTQDQNAEIGWLQNIVVDENGNAKGSFEEHLAFLDGEFPIAGRSLVMHALNGDRMTCGEIVQNPTEPYRSAKVDMNPYGQEGLTGCMGTIWIDQFQNPKQTCFKYDLSNCGLEGDHGFHVHQKADFSNKCVSTGGHYNPTNEGQDGEIGWLPSISIDANGNGEGMVWDSLAFLDGPYNIAGRSLVMHALDGDRMTCGTIEDVEKPCLVALVNMMSYGDNNRSGCSGLIWVKQYKMDRTEFHYDLSGCGLEGNHGFHVHEQADFSDACMSTGGHYNPTGVTDVADEVGMLPSIAVDADGNAKGMVMSDRAFIFGEYPIDNRSLVMHTLDGKRFTCGKIQLFDAPPKPAAKSF